MRSMNFISIQDVTVHDRLTLSNIKEMLYQVCNAMPKPHVIVDLAHGSFHERWSIKTTVINILLYRVERVIIKLEIAVVDRLR